MATDPVFLRACRGEPHDTVPVWFMRQAGRALPEYRAIRAEHSMQEVVETPELAVEVTLQPVRRYGVDAAILFSDIVTPLVGIGLDITIEPGVGPVVADPVRRSADLGRVRPLEAGDDIPYVLETVRLLVDELSVPLIGFAGAPFTLASYLIEGGPSKNHTRTKAMMFGEPVLFRDLLERLADITIASLQAQIAAGARAVQLFDSWVGTLAPQDYREHVLPVSSRILQSVAGTPRIHFGVATGQLLALLAEAGADVVGVDWRVPLDVARRSVGDEVALQGNLDPASCFAPWGTVAERVRDVLQRSGGHPAYVFNLGHGVLPGTDPGILEQVVALVHEEGEVRG